jgi:eukaryotic-like serine/threonine-protein kinase
MTTSATGLTKSSSAGQTISLLAALFVLLCFFLPWVEVSAFGRGASVTGFQLASSAADAPDVKRAADAGSLLLVALCMMATVAACAGQLGSRGLKNQLRPALSALCILAGAVSVGVLIYHAANIETEQRQEVLGLFEVRRVVQLNYQIGAVGALLGSCLVALGGLVALASRPHAARAAQTGAGEPTPAHTQPLAAETAPGRHPNAGNSANVAAVGTPLMESKAMQTNQLVQSICANCGSAVKAAARFCESCGAGVVGTTGAQPAIPSASASPLGASAQPVPRPAPPNGVDAVAYNDAQIGRVVDGKYRLDAKVAAGGMGTVYRASRLMIGDTVAVKVLHPEHVADAGATERFRREAQAAARLKHPNAVQIYDFGVTDDGLVYLVMELVEGESLRQIIRGQGPLTPSAAAEVMRQACAAIDEAHRQSIIHRDIKPDNIIVSHVGNGLRVKVLDFGIAKLRDMAATNMTQTGSVMGTPHYMSPEQCVGEELDGRSDVYSLGVVLYEMLAGVVPFNSPTSTAVVVQHVTQAPPPLRAINMSIPDAVERVVRHALEKRREDRPPSAGALAEELTAAVGGAGTAQVNVPAYTASNSPAVSPVAPAVASGNVPTVVMRGTPAWGNVVLTPPSGANPVAPAGQAVSPSMPLITQAAPAAGTRRSTPIIAAAAVALIVGLSAAGYFIFAKASPLQLVLDEIKKNQLVKPEGSSAYDVYLKQRAAGLSAEDKKEISRKVTPALEKRADEIIARLKQDQIEAEADWSEAARAYEWLNELDARASYESRKHFALGRLAFLQKNYSQAIADFQRSIQLDSSWALPYNSLGRAYLNANKNDKTRVKEQYRRATEVEPNWYIPWSNLGALYAEVNDLPNAESALRRAIAIDGQRAAAHNLLAVVLEKQGRPCDALAEYKLALEIASSSAVAPGFDIDNVNRKIQKLSHESYCW